MKETKKKKPRATICASPTQTQTLPIEGKSKLAERLLKKSPAVDGTHDRVTLAVHMHQANRLAEAKQLFLEELGVNPSSVASLYSMAAILNQEGDFSKALLFIDKALALLPNFALANQARKTITDNLYGRNLEPPDRLGHRKQGGERFEQLLITKTTQLLGIQLQELGRLHEAREVFMRLFEDDPKDFIALYSLGVMAAQEGNTLEALEFLDQAIAANPTHPPSHFAKGTLLQGIGLYDDALASFNRANLIDPSYIDAWNNKANLLHNLSREYDAFSCLKTALEYHPNDEKLLSNTGTILTVLKRDTEAIPYFDRLLAINPDYEYAQGYRLFAKLHTCNWDNYEEERSTLIQKVRERKRTINPLAFFSISDDPADQLLCSQLFAQDRYPSSKEPLWRGKVYRHRKIRLGYLSPDFREHPVGHLMVGVIENHDRVRFETYGFSLGINDSSSLRQRFRLGFDHFLDCKEKTAAEIAQLIRAAEIDILIDLAGYTANARPEVLAMRPAPIQINYLGFPGTMGAPWMDFIIGDSIVIPADQEVYFQERVLRLPCCYLPIDDQVQVNPETPTRESMNLPSKGTIYCSFNHDYKINPRIWDIWMRLLRDDPQSTLWLMKLNEAAETNLRAEALKRYVDPKRLVFATRVPRIEDHLARYRLIDVFLDTMPYNAHSTVTDVIRSGGSVITLKGGSFASRVAASYISHSQAKTSKITDSIEEYEVSLAQVRQSALTSNSHDHGGRLMNCAEMARHLEALFEDARKSR